jgi:hypothetical protein
MSKEKDYLKMVEGSANAWASLPPLVRQLKDDALTVLLNNLEDLFSNCDDLFFDLSSRAASNAEQNLYFESMRELRFKKAGVINAFKQHFEQGFLALTQTPAAPRGTQPDTVNADSLTLVQNDTLEQEVAISGMISKSRSNCQEALYHLTTRLDYLIPRITIEQENNPLDPEQICRSFARACELFDINIKAKIIIFKQFDRLVAGKLIKVYSAANELLINSGVLPKISRAVHKQADNGTAEDASAAAAVLEAAAQTVSQLQFDFSELSNLLASMRRLNLTRLPNYGTFSGNPGPVMDNTELLNLLSRQQLPQSEQLGESQQGLDLRLLVQSILASSNPATPRALQQPDEDVINLVAMFFDFILDDRNLPVAIQALISRLQIPILKVALKDKSFFNQAGHPARKLINAIADASIGWEESEQLKRDKLYNKIFEIIQAINEQYADNEQVFAVKLQDLQQFVQQEEHRTALIERRTSQAIEGQAKTQQAKTLVQQLMFAKLEKLQLPAPINAFLIDQWQQLLVLIHLKHGEDSPEWLEAVQLVDDLIWASRRHEDSRSLQRLNKIRPELLQRVAHGLTKISVTAEASQSAIGAIGQVLDGLQAGVPVEFCSISAEQAVALGHTPGSGSKSWREMTALERQQARYKALTYEFIKKADAMPIGTWMSYEDSRRGKILRCKLAAKIDVSDVFVFVNRFGFKVMEKSRKDFAYDMQQHRATPLDTGVLFDRAMENIVGNLRQLGKPAVG